MAATATARPISATIPFENLAPRISGKSRFPTPAPPTRLNPTVTSTTSANLTWSDNSVREDGYKIERSTDGSNYSQITSVGANITSWTNSGLSSNSTYYYRVRSYNSYGNSTF